MRGQQAGASDVKILHVRRSPGRRNAGKPGRQVLVTGGGGFIGSHLCEKLIRLGDNVTCLDNFFTGQRSNVRGLTDEFGLQVITADVINQLEGQFDEIYNLACPASPPHYQADPVKTTKTCVIGAINVLDLAAKNGARVLQASTSEVYGDPEIHPQVEQYHGNVNPIGPRSCYDEGKRCAESLFSDYRRSHSVDTRIARIFNTYGPRMRPDDGRVVSNFIVQALLGEDLTIYGAGNQTRSFCYVDDLVDGLIALMRTEVGGEPINLGNPGEFTMLELAETVLEMTRSRSSIVHKPLPADDPRQRRPNIERARSMLGWEPRVNLRDGLERTIAYFDALLHNNRTPLAINLAS